MGLKSLHSVATDLTEAAGARPSGYIKDGMYVFQYTIS